MKYSENTIGKLIKSNDIEQIGQPLFKDSNISKIYFARVFDDGTSILLTNAGDWALHKFYQGYPISATPPENLISKKFHFFVDPRGSYQKALHDLNAIFQIYHPLHFIDRYIGYYDIFSFGAALQSTQVINFYFNHLDWLEKFKLYFYEKANPLIQESLKNKLILPENQIRRGSLSDLYRD